MCAKRADFHSLRHTLATNLARAGTSPRIAMEVMRHSDIKLTTKTYTDAGLLPVADAVVKLPSLMRKARSTQIGTRNLFRAGHDLSPQDTDLLKNESRQFPENEELADNQSVLVASGQDVANGSGGRARIDILSLRPELLTEAGTQIGTQGLQDPDLAKIVTAWPTLSSGLKAALYAIVGSAKLEGTTS